MCMLIRALHYVSMLFIAEVKAMSRGVGLEMAFFTDARPTCGGCTVLG